MKLTALRTSVTSAARLALFAAVFSSFMAAQDAAAQQQPAQQQSTQSSETQPSYNTSTVQSPANDSLKPASVDGGLGPCRIEFTVNDAGGKPVYGAQVNTVIRSGHFGVKRTELQVGTNIQGKAIMTGLPRFPKRSFTFGVSKDEKSTTYPYNSLAGCNQIALVVLK